MKRTIICILASVVFVLQSQAQREWTLSPTLGTNLSALKGRELDGTSYKAGMSLGLMAGPVFEKSWQLNFGLMFNQRYSSFHGEEPNNSFGQLGELIGNAIPGVELEATDIIEGQLMYWTVDIPLRMSYHFKNGLFLHGGAYANLLISANTLTETTTHIPVLEVFDPSDLGIGGGLLAPLLPDTDTQSERSQSTDGLKGLDGGLTGGIGADLGNFLLIVQYQYGFGEVINSDLAGGIRNEQAIGIHLAYMFSAQLSSSGMKPRYDLELIK